MLYEKNEKGEFVEVKEPVVAPEAPAVHMNVDDDPVKELSGVVRELANKFEGGNNAVKERADELEAQLAAYKEFARRGFPIPDADADATPEEQDEIYAGYNMAMQGKALQDKFLHPNKEPMTEEARIALSRYMCAFIKANLATPNPKDVQKFYDLYGPGKVKTALGDTGNTMQLPDIIEAEILAFMREKSHALQYARVVPMTSEKKSWNAESATSSVTWGNTTSQSDATVTEVELSAQELSAYMVVRDTTLADTVSDVVSWITSEMVEAAGLELDSQMFEGTGDPVSGLLTAACGYSVTMGTGSIAFSHVTADYLSEMIGKLDGLRKDGAAFYMRGNVFHFVRTLKDDNGSLIFQPNVSGAQGGNIWGYPFRENTQMPTDTSANQPFITFGNLRYFLVGNRLGSTSLQVDPWGLWATNRTRFKIYQRWALVIGLAQGFVRLITAAA